MKSLKPKTIDLYQSFFRRERLTDKQQSTYLKLALPAVTLGVMLVVSGVLYMNTLQLRKQYQPLEVYLADSATNSVYDKALALQTTEQQLRRTYDNLTAAKKLLASYPKLTKAVFDSVYSSRPDKLRLEEIAYDGDTGVLTLAGVAAKVTDPADYVDKLRATGRFDQLEYTGYSSDEQQGQAVVVVAGDATEYKFTVSCYLVAPTEVTP